MATPDEAAVQYGIQYPTGKIIWVEDSTKQVPGSYNSTLDASTAQGRGKVLDDWRTAVRMLELDPEKIENPRFVRRTIVRTFADATPVVD